MAGETKNISQMANKVSEDIFKHFRWECLNLEDENFPCVKVSKHSSKDEYTHPVDVVFYYTDPYTNKRVFFNTDLKSYKRDSINPSSIRNALRSLAKAIDCARVSPIWRDRYSYMQDEQPEVRGMLFVYNHDGAFHKHFYSYIRPSDDDDQKRGINLGKLPLERNQQIHTVDPKLISYLITIVNDMKVLHFDGTFPQKNYSFFYPDLRLHKTHGESSSRPATIEMLTGPFLIIKHEAAKRFDESTGEQIGEYPMGFVVYYNRPGSTHYEFMYFFDMLSNYQLLESKLKIRVRVACDECSSELLPNFNKAIDAYSQAWGFDDYKEGLLRNIEIERVETVKKVFSSVDIGWRDA